MASQSDLDKAITIRVSPRFSPRGNTTTPLLVRPNGRNQLPKILHVSLILHRHRSLVRLDWISLHGVATWQDRDEQESSEEGKRW